MIVVIWSSSDRLLAQTSTAPHGPLLTTRWYQDGPFAKFTPKHDRVGCWSTAVAQIMYYHHLKPHGRVRYECSDGTLVDVDLSSHAFDWNQFVDRIDDATSTRSKDELARFSFAAACVVRKDFGTGSYKRLLNTTQDLEDHYGVDAQIYVSLGKSLPLAGDELASKMKTEKIDHIVDREQTIELITTEINAGRPVYFHFSNITNFGHSTVIDGYRQDGDRFLVHLNYGAYEAEASKSYDLFGPIAQPDDVALRAYITIKPQQGESVSGDQRQSSSRPKP